MAEWTGGGGMMADDHAELLRKVGQRVRAAREAAGMTQDQLAQRIGLVRASVANLEAGRQNMDLIRAASILAGLGVDLSTLIQPGDLPAFPPPPHKVTIRPIFEVTCETCRGVVIDAPGSRKQAQVSRDDHIKAMLEADHG